MKDNQFVKIHKNTLLDLIHWARRYCDGRRTFAPSSFNSLYQMLVQNHPEVMSADVKDNSIKYWPYAQDGAFNEDDGSFDARPNP